jgi:hypothetical protein
VSFPSSCSEESYLHSLQEVTRMLKSKHGENYLVSRWTGLTAAILWCRELWTGVLCEGWAPAAPFLTNVRKRLWIRTQPHAMVLVLSSG